jgi:hypothetical protein
MLFVDTSVWSLAFRRDQPTNAPQVGALIRAIDEGEIIVTTGLVCRNCCRDLSGRALAGRSLSGLLRFRC